MAKKKEGFKGERFIYLPEELLLEYRKDPLIGNLYVRKIGFFPKVEFHYVEKEEGTDYAIISTVRHIPYRKISISSYLPMSLIHLRRTAMILGRSIGFISVVS